MGVRQLVDVCLLPVEVLNRNLCSTNHSRIDREKADERFGVVVLTQVIVLASNTNNLELLLDGIEVK